MGATMQNAVRARKTVLMSSLSWTRSASTAPIHELPHMRRRQRQLAQLDAERSKRRGHGIRGRRRHGHHAAFARTFGTERIGLGSPKLHRDGADVRKIARQR